MSANELVNPNVTYSTPANVDMVNAMYSESVGKVFKKHSCSLLRRECCCKTSRCSYKLLYTLKVVAIDNHNVLLEDQKSNESEKHLMFVLSKFDQHTCEFHGDKRSSTCYNASHLAPILVNAAKNSDLPDGEHCENLLKIYVRGSPQESLIKNVRYAAREMMGTGKTDSIKLLHSFLQKTKENGHYASLFTTNATVMKELVIINEKKIHKRSQQYIPEEKKKDFDSSRLNLDKYVSKKDYMTAFSIVPEQALKCASRMLKISTTDASHVTFSNINGINMYTTCHDANYHINPIVATYSLFEESEGT